MKVEITKHNVQKLQIATKVDEESGDLIVKLSVESKMLPEDIARVLNLQSQKARPALYFSIGSLQAEMDLEFITIKSEKIEKATLPEAQTTIGVSPAEINRVEAIEKACAPSLVECPKCHGKGGWMDEETHIDKACPMCEGRGSVPAADIPTELQATVPVATVVTEGDGAKPKHRRKAKAQPALPVA